MGREELGFIQLRHRQNTPAAAEEGRPTAVACASRLSCLCACQHHSNSSNHILRPDVDVDVARQPTSSLALVVV